MARRRGREPYGHAGIGASVEAGSGFVGDLASNSYAEAGFATDARSATGTSPPDTFLASWATAADAVGPPFAMDPRVVASAGATGFVLGSIPLTVTMSLDATIHCDPLNGAPQNNWENILSIARATFDPALGWLVTALPSDPRCKVTISDASGPLVSYPP